MGAGYRWGMLHEPRDMQLGGISLHALQRLRVVHAAMVLVVAIAWVLMLAGLPFASWTSKAWLAAATLCALLGLGVVLHITFWRFTRAGAERLEPALRDQRVRRIGARTIAHVVVSLVLCAILLAIIVTQQEDFGLVVLVAFLLLGLLGAPVWLAAVGDEEADERGRLQATDPHPPRSPEGD